MPEHELNIHISGDEARYLMAALVHSRATLPIGSMIQLYLRLNQLSQVQPPSQPELEKESK